MKTSMNFFVITVCILLSSCMGWDAHVSEHYVKSVYLGETSFMFEGEVFAGGYMTPIAIGTSDIIVSRLISPSNTYVGSGIPMHGFSGNKFQMLVDNTDGGIAIGNDSISDVAFGPIINRFPDGFSACQMMFYFNGNKYPQRPYFRDDENRIYHFEYVYVAEPIDLSGVETNEFDTDDWLWHHIETVNYDLNFTKPGWYLIVSAPGDRVDIGLEFTYGKNNWFLFSE